VVLIYTFLQSVVSAPGEVHDVYVIVESELDYRSYDSIAQFESFVVQTGKVYSVAPEFWMTEEKADKAAV